MKPGVFCQEAVKNSLLLIPFMVKKKAGLTTGHAHQAAGQTMGGRGFVCPTLYISVIQRKP